MRWVNASVVYPVYCPSLPAQRVASMDSHPHFDRGRDPGFLEQARLCIERSVQRIACRMESRAETISHFEKGISVMRLDAVLQNLIVPRHQAGRGIGMLLCKFGGAFDVGKKECDRAGRKVGHRGSIQD